LHHITSLNPPPQNSSRIRSKRGSRKNIPELFILNDMVQEEFCMGVGSNCHSSTQSHIWFCCEWANQKNDPKM